MNSASQSVLTKQCLSNKYQRIFDLEDFVYLRKFEAISGIPTEYHKIMITGANPVQVCRPSPNGFRAGRDGNIKSKGPHSSNVARYQFRNAVDHQPRVSQASL
ncbi:hypothetical protein N7G274_005226 [Stereocaulon virgatum]|uniref:Uncharacterized protein n=1 Tax=Stereocaulon virgatum TaxID=373712 RepID=A0ABR4AF71_9LECA